MLRRKRKSTHNIKRGFTLVEALVTLGILGMVVLIISSVFINAMRGLTTAKIKTVAIALANEHLELIRNMPYDTVGTITGWPTGSLASSKTVNRSNTAYVIQTKVEYVDDPFDGNVTGTIPGKPVDTVPTDYKRVEVTVGWPGSANTVELTGRFAPNGLETATNTGSLLITVFNASGQPVPLATVTVSNTTLNPQIAITNTTDINGNLQLLSLPPAVESYHIEVTKDGYSTDKTEPVTPQNPQPTKPDVSVLVQQATQVSFSIDLLSNLSIATVDETCTALSSIPFQLRGTKQTGENPPAKKYNLAHQTDASGSILIPGLEWDLYTLILNTPSKDIAGVNPPSALNLLPGTDTDVSFILVPHQPHSLLMTVYDAGSGIPISGASVQLTATGYDTTKVTGEGFLQQTDWSQGSGQETFGDANRYQSDDGNIDATSSSGSVSLTSTDLPFSISESFTGNEKKDTVVTTADWNTSQGAVLLPQSGGDYALSAAAQSLKLNNTAQLITSATLTTTEILRSQTVRYYLAADGASFEQVTPGTEHLFASPGFDLRFRIEMETTNPNQTPEVQDVTINGNSSQYALNGQLTSSTFDTVVAGTFSTITWQPTGQISQVGAGSVKFQLASNNDNTTWNYVGPDGTADTFYLAPNTDIADVHNGQRYIRYRLFLQTENAAYSPTVSDVSLGYTSACTPPGQVFFGDLSNITYTVTITHPNYQPFSGSIDVQSTTTNDVEMQPL